ncbi:HEPN domain-containing protein [Zobellia sp. 1_MG-2023]|uniref:HEPN domain-containing protein n=1 Tax=Zobellia sp. 1_MG-2023 TaxID=3062626 RepID=UPI0026E416D1|nr:HEPN domain-containing protein [Zobellia sp. 1_MG-2023]MDO6821283.1 HEPN domain-containing protein [Zobellia sp. 1_MG-2023]
MKISEILNRISELINTSSNYENTGEMSRYYGQIDGPQPDKFLIVISGRERIVEFKKLCQKLWKNRTDIYQTISYETFESGIIAVLRRSIEQSHKFDTNELKKLQTKFSERKITKYEIFKELKGCEITSHQPITINDFTFYNWPKHSKVIKEQYPIAFSKVYPSFYNEHFKKVLVSYKIESRDYDRANEIADDKFKQLENILRFLFTHSEHCNKFRDLYEIGFFELRQENWLDSKVISNEAIGGHTKIVGNYRTLRLNKTLLTNDKKTKAIWRILQKANTSKLETRLLNSIEWIGKAKHELEPEKAFIQFLFAIEALMNFNEVGIISPSITYGMRESIAFLIGKNPKERLEIDELFTKLYAIRSSIVHGSKKEFTSFDIEDASNLAEEIVRKFISTPKLMEMGIDKVKAEIKKRKYASS